MRQTFGEDVGITAGITAPTSVGDGTDTAAPFRKAFRASKYLLTVVVEGTGTINNASLHGYSARNGGKWGAHRGTSLDGATLAVGNHNVVVENFGGYLRAAFVYAVASGAPTVTAFLTEIIDGPTSVGD